MSGKNIMHNFTAQDHRNRLENIKYVNEHIEKYLQKNLITDYIQGQFIYPTRTFASIEEDDALLKMLAENGVGLVQIWEDMGTGADGKTFDFSHRLIDGKMYRPYGDKKQQTRDFLDAAHKYGLKVIPYTSVCFYMRSDENFDPAWALPTDIDLGHLAHCSVNSPGWRAQIMKQFAGIMDDYDYDGIYIDSGFIRRSDYLPGMKYYVRNPKLAEDDVLAFEETVDYDGGMEDMLSLVYSEVKSRGGILKVHKDGCDRIHSDMKLYDYLWVGECVREIGYIKDYVKEYKPFVVPDYNFALENDDERYLYTVPYMQFPVVRNGKMGIGSPDVGYPDFDRQLKWLKLYKKLTTTGTWCYVEAEIEALVRKSSKDIVTSLFVNNEMYIVLANYDTKDAFADIAVRYSELKPGEKESEIKKGQLTLKSHEIKVLKVKEVFENAGSDVVRDLSDGLIGK